MSHGQFFRTPVDIVMARTARERNHTRQRNWWHERQVYYCSLCDKEIAWEHPLKHTPLTTRKFLKAHRDEHAKDLTERERAAIQLLHFKNEEKKGGV